MINLALILFSNERESIRRPKLLNKIYFKIRRFFSINLIDTQIKRVKVNEELNIHFIKVKYTLKEVSAFGRFKIKRLKKEIYKCFIKNSLDKCILPSLAPKSLESNICIKNPFSGRFIYTVLLVKILKKVAEKRNVSVKGLEIGIIQGNNNKLFFSYIRLLSPLVKFITIITNKKKYVQEKTEDIYDETGLAIRLTEDIESGLDDIDIVINLGDIRSFKKGKKIKSNAVVINYGNAHSEEIIFDNIVINSISIQLDNSIESILDQNIIGCFSKLELASIIFCHGKKNCANINKNNVDNKIINDVSNQFFKSGYKITALGGSFQGEEYENLELI